MAVCIGQRWILGLLEEFLPDIIRHSSEAMMAMDAVKETELL
jgi:hypothetical protein